MKNKTSCSFALIFSIFLMFSACNFSLEASVLSPADMPVFIIDAGHGGEDGGAIAFDNKTLEKDLNLQIAHKVRDMLSSYGLRTYMIRTDDRSVYDESAKTLREKKSSDLRNRLKIIESYENSILISIHQNKFTQSKYSGAQVFFSPNNPKSEVLASDIQSAIHNLLQNDNTRQIKKSNSSIFILYQSTKPAVLVECGFLSNLEETKKLTDEIYQQKLSFSIVSGILNYLNHDSENLS